MLTIPLEKLAFIIIKAREYDVEDSPVDVDSGSNPTDDGATDVLEVGVLLDAGERDGIGEGRPNYLRAFSEAVPSMQRPSR